MDGRHTPSQKLKRIIYIVVLGFAVLGVIFRYYSTRPDATRYQNSVGTSVSLEGIITEEPATKAYGQSFVLDVGKQSVLVDAGRDPTLAYGDKVTVTGVLELPQNFMTDQGTEFDYVSYLYKDNILYEMKKAKVAVLSHDNGNWLVARLIPVKNAVVQSFHRVLPGREADLLAGLNLGEKSNISKQFRDDLVTTGTIHIIALSGYNVTIIANVMRTVLPDIFGAIGIVLFVTMTGLQSSAIRAGIMALIGLFARAKGRTYDAFRALVLAAVLMLMWNPKYLLYDVSFQLSFLATLGILFITPILEQRLARIPKGLRELMSVTLGAQLGVLPFILYKMGTLSLIALPANILILPAVPYAMGFGLLAGLVGSFSVMLAYPISFITHLLLKYITGMVTYFAKVPYASVMFHHFPLWLCLGLYAVLVFIIYRSVPRPSAS